MTELPIIVETSAWAIMLFGVMLLAVTFLLVQNARWSDEPKTVVGSIIGALVTGALGLALIVQHLGWELRVDDKGIVLHAPFDPMHPGGAIAWADMESVAVIDRPYRGSSYYLRIRGRRVADIMVTNADRLPPQFVAALQKTVAERAPQVHNPGYLGEEFDYARRNSSSMLANSYSARDGRGNPLR